MKRPAVLTFLAALGSVLALLLAGCAAEREASAPRPESAASATEGWRSLPDAPVAVQGGQTSVWTGKEMIVSGSRVGSTGGPSRDVAAAYDPAANSWRRLPAAPAAFSYCRRGAVWTGKEMLVWGCGQAAFDPATNRWRSLPRLAAGQGIVVWTGKEMIGWGGGCCGDAWAGGAAYAPATHTWRTLAASPLAPEQQPLGAWTGRELVLFVSGINPADGRPWPARFARAAAYDPATDTWRRIAALPEHADRFVGAVAWDGREVLVAGAGAHARAVFGYNPAANRWRRLASLPRSLADASAVWTGSRLLLWGSARSTAVGLTYDPQADRWVPLPHAPVSGQGQTVAWSGRELLVWGGVVGTPAGTREAPRYPRGGAAFRPPADRSAR